MTKAFLHGRTEAIRTVQSECIHFVKVTLLLSHCPRLLYPVLVVDFFLRGVTTGKDRRSPSRMREARTAHEGVFERPRPGPVRCLPLLRILVTQSPLAFCFRHLYALYCLLLRELKTDSDVNNNSLGASALPEIFRDNGWSTLGTSILSTSNCGNPALRMFGFGPVAADGYGLGYIIKDDGLSVCAASKHLQTRRFLDTLQGYLEEVQRVLVALVRAANERPEPFVDHAGVLRDSKTGRRINAGVSDDEEEVDSIRAFSVLPLLDEME